MDGRIVILCYCPSVCELHLLELTHCPVPPFARPFWALPANVREWILSEASPAKRRANFAHETSILGEHRGGH
ncbi:MAG TPA: hypothetical protein VK550_16120 [Polyangiaceae bacterium]|nr:hypothetical protein [Polyangiaceae bacterium]